MAAVDLHRGLDHNGRGWMGERVELQDTFDSEMKEWEDQLHDMQKKIEELYNEVKARREGHDIAPDNEDRVTDFGLLSSGIDIPGPRGNGSCDLPARQHKGDDVILPSRCGDGFGYPRGYGYPVVGYICASGNCGQESEYSGQGHVSPGKGWKNISSPNTALREMSPVGPGRSVHQDELTQRGGADRIGQDWIVGRFVEDENRKNRAAPSVSESVTSWRGPPSGGDPNKENTAAKLALRQREASPVPPPRSAGDRKCPSPAGLADRKCLSPSVLRKFGAMLRENEGKTLTDSGVLAPEHKGSAPSCSRRLGAIRSSARLSVQKCVQRLHARQGEASSHEASLHPGPTFRNMPRASHSTGPERDPTAVSVGLADQPGSQRCGNGPGLDLRTEAGLLELFDMLEIEHHYSSSPRDSHTLYQQDTQRVTQVSLTPPSRASFSRPSRPTNKRPPSRWAGHAPTATIPAPYGPVTSYSPAQKHSIHSTETIIM